MSEPAVAVAARPCRSCGVMVFDLRHVDTNRHAPIEAEPVADGTIVIDLTAGTYRHVGHDFQFPDLPRRYRNHFATCPEAQRYRGRRAR